MGIREIIRDVRYRPRSGEIPVGVVGVGGWGSNYLPRLANSRKFELKACYDVDRELLVKACAKWNCQMASSYQSLLEDYSIRAVFIVIPNFLHKDYILEAIHKNVKYIFVEKPIANTMEDAREIFNTCKDSQVILSVGHNVRRRPEFRAMKRLIDRGEVGKVLVVDANNSQSYGVRRCPGWRLDREKCPGGSLLQLGIHLIDVLQFLCADILEVNAYLTNRYVETGIDDTAVMTCKFESGILGSIVSSYSHSPAFELLVLGTDANLLVRNSSFYVQSNGREKKVRLQSSDVLVEQIDEFAECIVSDRVPEVGVVDAAKALAVVDACIRSSNSGTTVSVSGILDEN